MAPAISPVFLPAELYYPICSHVASRRDLRTLAATARVLQRPAEAVLHHTVVLNSRSTGAALCAVLEECPRFAPLVCALELEWTAAATARRAAEGLAGDEYWTGIRAALSKMSGLETLTIADGRDLPLSWILGDIRTGQLRVLRCAFVLDADLLKSLQNQSSLEELSWTGALIALPPPPIPIRSSSSSKIPQTDLNLACHDDSEDPDTFLMTVLQHFLPPSVLPCLRILHSESLALARTLVPGRAITHLWVPGASFAAPYSSDYTYRHLSPSFPTSVHSASPSYAPGSAQQPSLVRLSGPRADLSDAARTTQLCAALREFGRSTGPVRSLRLALELPLPALREVLTSIAREHPSLRALGFLPASVLDPASDIKQEELASYHLPLPVLPRVHTLSLWSMPSHRALNALEGACALPALRTLACLHFSPAFEWVCLPVNERETEDETEMETGGICWDRVKYTTTRGGLTCTRMRRRLTAVHDPENLLWREV